MCGLTYSRQTTWGSGRAWKPFGVRTVTVPGGTQALTRSAPIEIRSRSSLGTVPLPSLLGAILIKTRAIEVDDLPDNQRSDVAFLFSLVEDPDELVARMTAQERGWLRRHPYFGDPRDACWTEINGAEADVGVGKRLSRGRGYRGPSPTGPYVELLQSMHSERLRDLATVIAVVRDHSHQHRLPGMDLDVAIELSPEFVLKHVRRPPLQAPLHDLPG